jgi:hypothetical protein
LCDLFVEHMHLPKELLFVIGTASIEACYYYYYYYYYYYTITITIINENFNKTNLL